MIDNSKIDPNTNPTEVLAKAAKTAPRRAVSVGRLLLFCDPHYVDASDCGHEQN